MDYMHRQNRLHEEKTHLNQMDLSAEGAEMFLKAQSYTVVNLMKDVKFNYGQWAETAIDKLWNDFYEKRKTWNMESADPIKKKQEYTLFADQEIQNLHFNICRTVQHYIDDGRVLR